VDIAIEEINAENLAGGEHWSTKRAGRILGILPDASSRLQA